MKRTTWLLLLTLAGMLIASCDHNVYRLEMTVQDDVLIRELTVRREGNQQHTTEPATTQAGEEGVAAPASQPASEPASQPESTTQPSISAEEFAIIKQAYPKELPATRPGESRFVGRFKGKTPDDIGGAGSFTRYHSNFGDAYIYSERFRGNDDLAADVEARRKAASHIADLLVGWFSVELKADPGLKPLTEFLDGQFRKDLFNLGLYARLPLVMPPDQRDSEKDGSNAVIDTIARMTRYLVERGYFSPDDAPAFARLLKFSKFEDKANTLPIQRMIAMRMGVPKDKPVPASLAFLATLPDAKESLEAYLRGTEDYNKRLRLWQEEQKKAAAASRPATTQPAESTPPEPLSVLTDDFEELLGSAIAAFTVATPDDLTISLVVGVKPALTNGKFDEATGKIHWEKQLNARFGGSGMPLTDPRLPELAYAVWSRPNEKFQQEHFGKVALADNNLLEYCLWRNGLTAQEAKEWDAFVSVLRPGPQLPEVLATFAFSRERKAMAAAQTQAATQPSGEQATQPTTQPSGYAAPVIEKLINAVKP